MDWRKVLFKPVILVIGSNGGILIDPKLSRTCLIEKPDCLRDVFEKQKTWQRPLRIYLDTLDHIHFSEQLEPDNSEGIHQVDLSPSMGSECFIYHTFQGPRIIKGLKIPLVCSLRSWLDMIEALSIPVEGIYSLPLELIRSSSTPKLMILPGSFGIIRVLFSDGNGGIFCRFLDMEAKYSLETEVWRSLQYGCREFCIEPRNVSVISAFACPDFSKKIGDWQVIEMGEGVPEAFLIDLCGFTGKIPQRTSIQFLHKNWRAFLWNAGVLWFFRGAGLIAILISCLFYVDIGALEKKTQQIERSIEQLIEKTCARDIQAMEKTLADINPETEKYARLSQPGIMDTDILRKLMPTKETPIRMAQLSLVRKTAGSRKSLSIAMECLPFEGSFSPEEGETILQGYANLLKTRFSTGVVRAVYGEPVPEREPEKNHKIEGQMNFGRNSATIQIEWVIP